MKELGYTLAVIGIICTLASGSALWAHFIWMLGACLVITAPKGGSAQSQAPTNQPAPAPSPPPLASPPTAPNPPNGKFFVYIGNAVKGPFTVEQIRALSETGSISSDTQLCREGGLEWKPLSQFSI